MKQFIANLNKTSTTSVIALLMVFGFIIISTVSLFHKPADKDIALFIIGNLTTLVGYVAGYYFNKKQDPTNIVKETKEVIKPSLPKE